jgi:hypothetical protein
MGTRRASCGRGGRGRVAVLARFTVGPAERCGWRLCGLAVVSDGPGSAGQRCCGVRERCVPAPPNFRRRGGVQLPKGAWPPGRGVARFLGARDWPPGQRVGRPASTAFAAARQRSQHHSAAVCTGTGIGPWPATQYRRGTWRPYQPAATAQRCTRSSGVCRYLACLHVCTVQHSRALTPAAPRRAPPIRPGAADTPPRAPPMSLNAQGQHGRHPLCTALLEGARLHGFHGRRGPCAQLANCKKTGIWELRDPAELLRPCESSSETACGVLPDRRPVRLSYSLQSHSCGLASLRATNRPVSI